MATFEDYIVRRTAQPDGTLVETWRTLPKCAACMWREQEDRWRDGPRHFCTLWQRYTKANGWCYMVRVNPEDPFSWAKDTEEEK